MEIFFDENDVGKNPKVKPIENAVEDRNIGTEENPKIIKLSKNFPEKRKRRICEFNEKIYRCIFLELLRP